jgi:hypothetical protein
MATSQFQSFGLAPGAYVLSPAAWAALPARLTGYPPGILAKENLNTAIRQASSISTMIAAFVAAHQADNVLDDGDLVTLQDQFIDAINSLISTGSGTNRWFEAHNCVTLGANGNISFNSVNLSTGISQAGGAAFTVTDAAGAGLYKLAADVVMNNPFNGAGNIQFTKNNVVIGSRSGQQENENVSSMNAASITHIVSLAAGDTIRLAFTRSGACAITTGYGNLTGFKIA